LAVRTTVEVDDAEPWAWRVDAVLDDVGEVALQCCGCEGGRRWYD